MHMNEGDSMNRRTVVAYSVLVMASACLGQGSCDEDTGKAPGSEGDPCFGDETCDGGLKCLFGVCAKGPVVPDVIQGTDPGITTDPGNGTDLDRGTDLGNDPGNELGADTGPTCVPEFYKECAEDALYWFDSCDVPGDKVVDCPHGCLDGSCLICTPDCGGRECGPDPVCGASCGTCPESNCTGLTWTAAKTCITGACTGGTLDCDDGKECTTDTCDPAGGCSNVLQGGYCLIGGTCYTNGQANTGNACQECAVSKTTTDWTDATNGTPCGTGKECYGNQCVSVAVCGGITCPVIGGYNASCNTKQHCEYANPDTTGWKQWDVWVHVPAGSFPMGSSEGESGSSSDERPLHTVTFAKGYLIAKHPVTVSQYEACMSASPGTCTAPSTVDWSGNGWGTNTTANGRSTHPQNGLSWAQSGAVCAWLGGRRPSEAEWEYAAKGPVHRKYPWGDTPAPTCSNNTAVFNAAGGAAGYGCGTGGTWAVDSKAAGASWNGTLDMSGNVWEWVEDWWHSDYTGAPTDGSAWVVPAGSNRVIRGGSFNTGASGMRSSYRDLGPPGYRNADLGGRCLRPLQ